MRLAIATTEQINFEHTLWRYQAFGEDAANFFDGMTFCKAIQLNGNLHILSLICESRDIILEIDPTPTSESCTTKLIEIGRHILGLNFPLQEFYKFAKSDAILFDLTKKFTGLRPTLTHNLFEALVTSITAQQINLRFAFSVRSRLVIEFGESVELDGQIFYAFPAPERLAVANPGFLKKLQLTTKKSEYIIDIAEKIATNKLNLAALPSMSDDEISQVLLPIRGIGRWTIDWLLARGLGRGNAAPVGDLGVRKAIEKYYFKGEKQPEEGLRQFATRWGDFSNLAIHYLLKGLITRI